MLTGGKEEDRQGRAGQGQAETRALALLGIPTPACLPLFLGIPPNNMPFPTSPSLSLEKTCLLPKNPWHLAW